MDVEVPTICCSRRRLSVLILLNSGGSRILRVGGSPPWEGEANTWYRSARWTKVGDPARRKRFAHRASRCSHSQMPIEVVPQGRDPSTRGLHLVPRTLVYD